MKKTFRFHIFQIKDDRLPLVLSALVSQVTDLYRKCERSQHAHDLDFIVVTSIEVGLWSCLFGLGVLFVCLFLVCCCFL